MYHMTKKNIDQLLDVLDENLIVNVHHGDQKGEGVGGEGRGRRGS